MQRPATACHQRVSYPCDGVKSNKGEMAVEPLRGAVILTVSGEYLGIALLTCVICGGSEGLNCFRSVSWAPRYPPSVVE